MSHRSEVFGRLLRGAINSIAVYEGKTAPLIEEELGAQIGLAGSAIQRYKAGHLPPEERTLEIIAEAAIRRGFLGREWLERFLRAARHPESERLLQLLKRRHGAADSAPAAGRPQGRRRRTGAHAPDPVLPAVAAMAEC